MSNPFTEAAYFSQRNSVNASAARNRNAVEQQRRDFQAFDMPRAISDFQYGVSRGRAQVPSGLGRRGLLNSGVYRRALIDFSRRASLGAEDLQRGLTARQQAFELALADIEGQRTQALNQLVLERAGSRTQAAALVRSILGGN